MQIPLQSLWNIAKVFLDIMNNDFDLIREIQEKYNKENGITPTTIKKAVRDLISISKEVDKRINDIEKDPESMDKKELKKLMDKVEKKMQKAAAELDFETAIEMREKLAELKLMYNK